MSIHGAFTHAAVGRLKQSFASLPRTISKDLHSLNVLLSPSNNHERYRKAASQVALGGFNWLQFCCDHPLVVAVLLAIISTVVLCSDRFSTVPSKLSLLLLHMMCFAALFLIPYSQTVDWNIVALLYIHSASLVELVQSMRPGFPCIPYLAVLLKDVMSIEHKAKVGVHVLFRQWQLGNMNFLLFVLLKY